MHNLIIFIRPAAFQSTLPVWGATGRGWHTTDIMSISIHAPRVGSDRDVAPVRGQDGISIHAPRVGSDGGSMQGGKMIQIFQSTLPVWGATLPARFPTMTARYFNPRSPCGERHKRLRQEVLRCIISIHAPRVGSDVGGGEDGGLGAGFQSTLPVWGATVNRINAALPRGISIHAPRVGSDRCRWQFGLRCRWHFNPRSPCGERLERRPSTHDGTKFQSTLPVWGATP